MEGKLLWILCSVLLLFSLVDGRVSVSGISGGGYMAVQYHVAFSSELVGAGVIAGGPYWCAANNVLIALEACMKYPDLISLTALYAATYCAEIVYSIDPTSNLRNQKIWLFTGAQDSIVHPGVVKKLRDYYANYVNETNIEFVFNIQAEHSFVTDSWGNSCRSLGEPFINNCNFDSAGAMLTHIYGDLNDPVDVSNSSIIKVDQANFIPGGLPPVTVGLHSEAYAYIPTRCTQKNPNCKLHIAFHGCQQSIDEIGDAYFTHTGYNNWGEANDIIILYPQAASNVLNPQACFDWWGYSGPQYATKLGVQLATTKRMVDFLINKFIQ